MYNHLFNFCQPLRDSDTAFGRGEGVYEPITLTPQEMQVVVGFVGATPEGNNMTIPTAGSGGKIWGYLSSGIKLPMYEVLINMGGVLGHHKLMPQNTNKRDGNGNLTKPALAARAGASIMYFCEGDKKTLDAGGKRWLGKFYNGQLQK